MNDLPQLYSTLSSKIAQQIEKQGYIILPDFLSIDLLQALQLRIESLNETELKEASIGRGGNQEVNQNIRRDKTYWLDKKNKIDNQYLELMEGVKDSINQLLFLGLFDYESHYAVYQQGDFYKKHVDALKGKSNRVLSSVCYLNKQWSKNDGGELIIYNKDKGNLIERILPEAGTLVLFLSEEFPHEVLAPSKTRYSIAGWFRVNTSNSSNIDPFN